MSSERALLGKLKRALLAYERRGHDALAALAEEGAEAFFASLKEREVAFHNFAALDALARSKGVDVAADEQARACWGRIEALNQTLADLLGHAKIRLTGQLAAVARAEKQVRVYHSHSGPPLRLVKRA